MTKKFTPNLSTVDIRGMKAGPAFVNLVEKKIAEHEMKKKEVAAAIGITPSTFSAYMTARAAFPINLLLECCRVLKIEPVEGIIIAYGLANARACGLLEGAQFGKDVADKIAEAERKILVDRIDALLEELGRMKAELE